MSAQIDQIQIRTGQLVNLPILLDGEFGFTEDEKRLYIGSADGTNNGLPNMKDISILSANINGAINIANNASNFVGIILSSVNAIQLTSDNTILQSTTALNNSAEALATVISNQDTINASNALIATTATDSATAVTTATTASNNSITAIDTANEAIIQSTDAKAQIANIITSNGDGTIPTELLDMRTSEDSTVWTSAGDHIRNLDKICSTLKSIQSYTATSDNVSVIPIPLAGTLDLTKVSLDVFSEGILLDETTNYTIDTTSGNINLVGWTLSIGDKLKYRIYR